MPSYAWDIGKKLAQSLYNQKGLRLLICKMPKKHRKTNHGVEKVDESKSIAVPDWTSKIVGRLPEAAPVSPTAIS